jgi:hypothetical protein
VEEGEEDGANCRLFSSLNLANNFLNNILFLFLSLAIDALMIRHSNRIIQEKLALNCPHLKEAITFKTNLNKMILTNGTLYFVSHVPEFVATLLLICLKNDLFSFCYWHFACFELIEMAQTFHFVSIGLQFFVFLKFDQNFVSSFRCLFRRLVKL